MNRPARGQQIVLGFVTIVVALAFTSHALNAKKPPKPPPPVRPVLYEVTWIPGLADPDDSTVVCDVNASGQFVGKVWTLNEPYTILPIYGFVDESGSPFVRDLNDLLPSDLNAIEAIGINDQGRIVGHFRAGNDVSDKSVFAYDYDDETQSGVLHVMDVPGYEDASQHATRLAEDGSVVGYIRVPDIGQLGFIWIPGTDTDPIVELLDFGAVTGINNAGDIVGRGMFYSAWPYVEPDNLGPSAAIGFGFAVTSATGPDINDAGTIVGTPAAGHEKYYYASYCDRSNFAWNALPSKYSSYALAINDGGQIVGGAQRAKQPNSSWTVFVNDTIDGYWLIDDLIPEDFAGRELWLSGDKMEIGRNSNEPVAISEPETDTGYGFVAGFKWINTAGGLIVTRGFVLTPVPVPAPPDSQ